MPPGSAWAKGTRLLSWSWRPMVGDDRVDHADPEALDDRLAIGLGAQRRHQLAEGAVVADREIVQREVRRAVSQLILEAARLGGGDHLTDLAGRDLRQMQAAAGHLDQADIALDHHDFGERRVAGKSEPASP